MGHDDRLSLTLVQDWGGVWVEMHYLRFGCISVTSVGSRKTTSMHKVHSCSHTANSPRQSLKP